MKRQISIIIFPLLLKFNVIGCLNVKNFQTEDFASDNNFKDGGASLGSIGPLLYNLGTVEGKSYIVDSTNRTWRDSLRFCSEFGMTLGSITSEQQMRFLKGAYHATIFNGWFWTAGRDQHQVGEFSFHSINVSVLPLTTVVNGMESDSYLTCLCYSANDGYYYIRECDHSHYTLCETSTGVSQITGMTRPTTSYGTRSPYPYIGLPRTNKAASTPGRMSSSDEVPLPPPTKEEGYEEDENGSGSSTAIVVVICSLIALIILACLLCADKISEGTFLEGLRALLPNFRL